MIVYFANRSLEIIGMASTNLPQGFALKEDLMSEELETGLATFSGSILYSPETRIKCNLCAKEGNYILRKKKDRTQLFTITENEEDTSANDVYFYAEDAGLDLINEVALSWPESESNQTAKTLTQYVQMWIQGTGFAIGINESGSETRQESFEEQTTTERLREVADRFGFEIEYSFDIDASTSLSGLGFITKKINIYKKRGSDDGVQLRLNREVNKIVTKKSVNNIATSLLCYGSEVGGVPLTLSGYSFDDDNFVVAEQSFPDRSTTHACLQSRDALKKWGRTISGELRHITRTFNYDTVDRATLCREALKELKKICEPEVNYDVDIAIMPDNVRIGDTVYIVDDEGELYLSARTQKIEESVCDDKTTLTLGDYLIKDGGISTQVEDLAKQFSELAQTRTLYTWIAYADDAEGTGISLSPVGKSYMGTAANQLIEEVDITDPTVFLWSKVAGEAGEDAAVLRIDSSRGTVFKNNQVSTVLSVAIYAGNKRITGIDMLRQVFGSTARLEWHWQRVDEENFGLISADDSRLSNNGFNFTLSPSDVDTKCVFMCNLITD